MRQLMIIGVGLALAYSAGNNLPLPGLLRLALAAVIASAAVALALRRPGGRSLDDWAFVPLRYGALPRLSVWRPQGRDGALQEVSNSRHEVILPSPSWARGGGV